MQKKKFLILRNYTIEPVFNEIEHKFHNKGLKIQFDYSSYDSALPELIKMPYNKLNNYDGILIFLSFESFVSKMKNNKTNKNLLLFKNLIKGIFDQLKVNKIDNFSWFIFSHQEFRSDSISQKKLESEIFKFKKNISNFYNLKNEIFKFHSIKTALDKRYWTSSMFPFSALGLKIVTNIIFLKIQFLIKNKYKLIILDADNTLWNGVIDEIGVKNINFKNNYSKINYLIFQKKIKDLKKKGILLSLSTKNDLESIRHAFNFHKKKMKLKLNDFLVIKANWKDKFENIIDIHKKLNLSPENSLFIDDSNFEINSISSTLPAIDTQNILEFENYHKNIDKIVFPEKIKRTKEDFLREKLYIDEFKRTGEKEKHRDFKKYIKSLNIVIKIERNSKKNLFRLAQLSQRTNQFNSTTIRYNEKSLKTLLKNKENKIFQCSAKDNFGNYGIIGLIIVQKKGGSILIKNFAMSCRALGREIEINFFRKVINSLGRFEKDKLFILFRKNNKNKLVEEFLKKNCKRKIYKKNEFLFTPKYNLLKTEEKLITINYEK
tara:strand:+ start:3151 stop:4791 length:1641 start_codon:yes stop_codon:yes gene_type:complete